MLMHAGDRCIAPTRLLRGASLVCRAAATFKKGEKQAWIWAASAGVWLEMCFSEPSCSPRQLSAHPEIKFCAS